MSLFRLVPPLTALVLLLPLPALAQSPAENLVRMEQLESRVRQLNGIVEQLQFRNQQLEQQLKRFQEDVEFRFQDMRGGGGTRPAPAQPTQPGRRSDAFDPTATPAAAGAPRPLGAAPAPLGQTAASPPVGAPGGRAGNGQPLDLGSLAQNAVNDPTLGGAGAVMAPPLEQHASAAAGQMTSRQEYDLAYGHLLRQDYPTAESGFRDFLRKYPHDMMAANANFWLGESLFQRQRHVDAARSFLTVATDFPKAGKAPDAMLRLGQSLAAMGQKDEACATFAQVPVKYPKASASVKASVDRERKRAGC